MPLPAPDTAWPPARLAPILPRMGEWSAWLAGEPDTLTATYSGQSAALDALAPTRRQRIRTVRQRMFWGGRPTDVGQPAPHRLHIPLPADIATASAGLMFGSPPVLTVADKLGTATINRLIEERALWETCTSAFTVGAGLGGTYLRASWDPAVPGGAFLSKIDADQASPVFSPYGDLVEVTFVRTLEALHAGAVTVWRHLERHYLAPAGAGNLAGFGMIEHTLWAGTDTNIGSMKELSAHWMMEPFGTYRGALPYVLNLSTGSRGLAVEYVKNKAEQLGWRHHPVGAWLGRSDFDQLEGEFDALDRVWSSLIREIDLAKARVFIPSALLRSMNGAGSGAAFDMDRELFTPLEIPPSLEGGIDQSIKMSDFPIRVDEHIKAANEIQQGILRDAGYSARTFGEDENGNAMTATEVIDRNSRSGVTRNSKCNLAGPAIRRVLVKIMEINGSLGLGAVDTSDLTLSWPQSESESPETRARTVQALDAAGAISLWLKVTRANPGLDREDLLMEYRRIRAEGMANPDMVGGSVSVDDPFNPDMTPGEAEQVDGGGLADAADTKAKADAMGVLVRAGVDQAAAAELVGFAGIKLSGGIPTSLRPAASDAAGLEQA